MELEDWALADYTDLLPVKVVPYGYTRVIIHTHGGFGASVLSKQEVSFF